MKKYFFVFFTFSFFSVNAQITKGNWLIGGSINFSSNDFTTDLFLGNTTSEFQVAGNAGFFFIDKLAIGLKPNIYYSWIKTSNGKLHSNRSFLGPFIRYYLLNAEQRVNLFAEGNYFFGIGKSTGQETIHLHGFSIAGGPVIFLNSSVGLELSIGYAYTKWNQTVNTKTKVFQTGIGLQFHLERETKK